MYKLNIDGSARDNIITGGEVIRDSFGRFIAGFSIYFGNGKTLSRNFLHFAKDYIYVDTCTLS